MNTIKKVFAFIAGVDVAQTLLFIFCGMIWLIAAGIVIGIMIAGSYGLVFISVESWLRILEQLERLQ